MMQFILHMPDGQQKISLDVLRRDGYFEAYNLDANGLQRCQSLLGYGTRFQIGEGAQIFAVTKSYIANPYKDMGHFFFHYVPAQEFEREEIPMQTININAPVYHSAIGNNNVVNNSAELSELKREISKLKDNDAIVGESLVESVEQGKPLKKFEKFLKDHSKIAELVIQIVGKAVTGL